MDLYIETPIAGLKQMPPGLVRIVLALGYFSGAIILRHTDWMVVGVVIVEVVFVYPGLGYLMVDSVLFRDMPMVRGTAMVFATTYVLLNLLADILSIIANPRLRHRK